MRDKIIPADRVPFSPPEDYRGMTISMATLWQDPATKSSSMLIKLNKGADAPHLHTFDYHILVVEGEVAHRTASIAGSQDIVLGLQKQSDIEELPGPERIVRVGKCRLEADRAGGLIDHIIDQQQRAPIELGFPVAGQRGNRDGTLRHRLGDRLEIVFRQ